MAIVKLKDFVGKSTVVSEPAPKLPPADLKSNLGIIDAPIASKGKEVGFSDIPSELAKTGANFATFPLRVAKDIVVDIPVETYNLIKERGLDAPVDFAKGIADTGGKILSPLVSMGKFIFGSISKGVEKATGYTIDPNAQETFDTAIAAIDTPEKRLAVAQNISSEIQKFVVEHPDQLMLLLDGLNKSLNSKGKPADTKGGETPPKKTLEQQNLDTAKQIENTEALRVGNKVLTQEELNRNFLDLPDSVPATPAISKPPIDVVSTAAQKTGVPQAADFVAGAVKTGVEGVKTGAEALSNAKNSLFEGKPPAKNANEVVAQASETLKPADILAKTEGVTAKPSLIEKWSGISPDIKNRIAGKQAKLKEYFDVAHARNNFDTLPTPLEHAAKSVDSAVTKMDTILNDTGSEIGNFRRTISSYEAPIDSVRKIETQFSNQLGKLNLEIKDGVIRQVPGKVTRVGSQGDIKVLNDIYSDFRTVKENPSLEKLIDLRNIFDNKINFAKSSREASNSVDPLSRVVRTEIKNVAAEIVGKEQAANLTKYSEFMDAYKELKGFTDRKAGAEFLLKQVLSERGGTPREVMNTIKEFTGIDLMDDATMAQIATDLIGNSRQKGVFRQEITKAGLDAKALLSGDPTGAINLMFNYGKKALINEEKQFLKAAE